MYLLRVVIGSGDVPTSELPREDLALCNDPVRVALQAIVPKCDAKDILERTSGMAPGTMRILGNNGDGACRDGEATQAPGTGSTGGATYPWDSRRAGKRPQSPSPPKSHNPRRPPSPPRIAA
ncbi:hypothetical protein E2562_031749 [Oryza meyeriana var. granulata]|uniref:Uncharacterized protein n=1 Tax=Oryza meyeriana var. granulata TaxID=110450 RepID=A0A6G1CVF1_9ORYZ|nr:hypothetical protein E2562_031749 [Oryza meyeriana var. granulata]